MRWLLERVGASQEQFNVSNGYVPFGNSVPFCVYYDSIIYISAHFRNLEFLWKIAIPGKLILEMQPLSVTIYAPDLQV